MSRKIDVACRKHLKFLKFNMLSWSNSKTVLSHLKVHRLVVKKPFSFSYISFFRSHTTDVVCVYEPDKHTHIPPH